MAAWQYSASNFGLLLFFVLFAQLRANCSTSNRNSTHSIHTFRTKCLRISWFGSKIRGGDILWKINQEINMCYRQSFSYPLFEGQWGLDQWLPRQAKGTQPPSSEEMLISRFTLKFCVFVYFGAGRNHLAVFIQKCEIVEDVSAEHDVLARVDSQHHWHLYKN